MKFIYSTHAKRRMRERKISGSIVKKVVDEPKKTIVSIHPIRDDDFNNRIKSGRWV